MGKAMQNLGNTKTSNEEIKNIIIKKENGVNPFIAVMNFKISLKTWLKHARINLKKQRKLKKGNYAEDTLSHDDEDDQKTIAVEIEIEETFEETSEEENTQSQATFRQAGSGSGS